MRLSFWAMDEGPCRPSERDAGISIKHPALGGAIPPHHARKFVRGIPPCAVIGGMHVHPLDLRRGLDRGDRLSLVKPAWRAWLPHFPCRPRSLAAAPAMAVRPCVLDGRASPVRDTNQRSLSAGSTMTCPPHSSSEPCMRSSLGSHLWEWHRRATKRVTHSTCQQPRCEPCAPLH
jgi:hypothetical protein